MKVPVLLAIVILGISSTANAAKCKFAKDEVDPFTEVKTLQTKWDQLTSTWMADSREIDGWISVIAVDDYVALWLKLDYTVKPRSEPSDASLKNVIVIPEGAPLLILMPDDSIIELPAVREVRADAYAVAPWDHPMDVNTWTVRAAANIKYAMPPEAIAALKAQDATDLRITAANRGFDIEIHKKSRTDFQNAFACMDL
jgi:hypothetical protein